MPFDSCHCSCALRNQTPHVGDGARQSRGQSSQPASRGHGEPSGWFVALPAAERFGAGDCWGEDDPGWCELTLIARRFVWGDSRPDDADEIYSDTVDHRASRDGVLFLLRDWDIRYRPGERRLTEAVYDEAHLPVVGTAADLVE